MGPYNFCVPSPADGSSKTSEKASTPASAALSSISDAEKDSLIRRKCNRWFSRVRFRVMVKYLQQMYANHTLHSKSKRHLNRPNLINLFDGYSDLKRLYSDDLDHLSSNGGFTFKKIRSYGKLHFAGTEIYPDIDGMMHALRRMGGFTKPDYSPMPENEIKNYFNSEKLKFIIESNCNSSVFEEGEKNKEWVLEKDFPGPLQGWTYFSTVGESGLKNKLVLQPWDDPDLIATATG